jgi:hypothetical protein
VPREAAGESNVSSIDWELRNGLLLGVGSKNNSCGNARGADALIYINDPMTHDAWLVIARALAEPNIR